MRKFAVLILLLSVLRIQSQALKPFSWGPILSYNTSNAKAFPDFSSVSPDGGIGLGGFARLKILLLYAEVDVMYATHSFSGHQSISGNSYISSFDLNGFDLSGILGWRVFGIGRLGNFRLFTGYNYQAYSTAELTTNGMPQPTTNLSDSNGNLILGTGFDIWRIVLNVKYLHGFKDLNTLADQELKTRMLNFELGFKF